MYNKRQELILDFIKDNPSCKREDIEKFLVKMQQDVTKMTITRDLKILMEDGVIEKSGLAKATVYKPSLKLNLLQDVNIETYFIKDQDKRLPNNVYFNFDIFPALKNLITPQEQAELATLNETYRHKKAELSPKLLQKEFERLTVELAWKSSQIEGNTYTLLDTERLLKEHVSAKGKTAEETNMVLAAAEYLDNETVLKHLPFISPDEIDEILDNAIREEAERFANEESDGLNEDLISQLDDLLAEIGTEEE